VGSGKWKALRKTAKLKKHEFQETPRIFSGFHFASFFSFKKIQSREKSGSANAAQPGKKAIFLFGSNSDFSPRLVHAFRKDLSFGKT